MPIRELTADDENALRVFFDSIPVGDLAFFKEDLDEAAVQHWTHGEQGVRLAAFDDSGVIVAVAAVWPGVGRSRHVGALRIFVASGQRGQGFGSELARTALVSALRQNISKISVEVVAHEQGTIDMFLGLGFVAEALLRDQLRTVDGTDQDVMVLSHFAEEAGFDVLLAAPEGMNV